jgi:alpha-galactosidase
VDATRFPNGLKAISDHAHEKGLKIILWFEPERVHSQTWLTEQHPDWISNGADGGLLNLGNDEARAWLIDHVDKLMNEQGIDLYRQDFNYEPLKAWRANDAKESPEGERNGITENKHIVGLFAYWDELVRRRNGNLLIDTCASGGRRNDLETLRRAVPLWRSDFPFDPTGTQCHTYGISFWIPLSGTGVKVIDNYDFRSNAAPEFTCHWDMREKSLDYDLLRRQLEEWRGYSPNFMGDYYPLTEFSTKADVWMAWQFDRPEDGKGMVQAFRRPNCPYTSAAFPLRGLDPNAQYSVTDIDAKTTVVVDGKTLMSDGVNVSAPKRPNATVLLYEKQ